MTDPETLKLKTGRVCEVHGALVEVLEKINDRLARLTVIAIIAGALTAGGLFKEQVLAMLVALAGGG